MGGKVGPPRTGRRAGRAEQSEAVPTATATPRLRATAGGVLLWGGTVAVGISTVLLLAVLSHRFHHNGFTGLSTLFGLFFVASLIPSGVPLRAAALEVDGAKPMQMTTSMALLMVAIGAVLTPPVAWMLKLPPLAVAMVFLQVVIAIPLAMRRGSLIASQRFDAMGGNLFLEAGARCILGVLAGLAFGLVGLAAGLAGATVVALVLMPRRTPSRQRTQRQITSLLHTWLAIVLLGLFVQLDILVAPSILTQGMATRYDLAAVPSKGVYLLLAAISTLIFPSVRIHACRSTVVRATVGTLGFGLVATGVLLLLRGTIGSILGQQAASAPLLAMLGCAMALAGATGVVLNGGIALGVTRPWPPMVFGMLCIATGWYLHPSAHVFASIVLGSEVAVLFLTSWVCLRRTSENALTRRFSISLGRFGQWAYANVEHLICMPVLPPSGASLTEYD